MKRKIKHAGFTLIELLVVLSILGLLAGLVGPRVMQYVGSSKSKTAKIQIEDIGAGLDLYLLDLGQYPSTQEGLLALVEAPANQVAWNGPYLKKKTLPKDPWGEPYYFKSPGEHGDYDLYSLGADKAQGGQGEDRDINNWE
ncbi:MAG: type II secretion system major pseudopilin GspG [Gammaproteobacteria bacterium]|nr:type II secretion system major pseudopilin GspG [Gammaproteobacteria bacterium]MDH5799971.1 type II secretion system major pseudopilin GspG [Gammaproteobacteria bacterium]